tara:strand:- start:1239 stop:3278 length:2040 start_codon:yes stop_codon:yes gene_type:complete
MINDKNLYNDEFDFGKIVKILWYNKVIIIFFIIFSIPVSINFIRSINAEYISEAVIQNPENSSKAQFQLPSVTNNFSSFGLLNNIASSSINKAGYISKLTSKEFIKTLINDNEALKSKLDIYCPSLNRDDYVYEPPSPYSLTGIMTSLRLVDKYIEPDENQLLDQVVNCVQGMIEIEPYKYKSKITDSIRVAATTNDPVFSAILVNEIVEKYISSEKRDKEKGIDKTSLYLSEKIADAKISLDTAIQNFQNFTIESAALFAIEKPYIDENFENVPFRKNIRQAIFKLAEAEKREESYRRVLSELKLLKEAEINELAIFIKSPKNQETLSRKFIALILDISRLMSDENSSNLLRKAIFSEIERLESRIGSFKNNQSAREEKINSLMVIEQTYNNLEFDVEKKTVLFEVLKDNLNMQIMQSGLEALEQPKLLSEAVPALVPINSNQKKIFLLGVLIATFLSIAFILIRQNFTKIVYVLNQVSSESKIEDLFHVSLKNIKAQSKKGRLTVGRRFLNNARESRKIISVIDLSNKGTVNEALAHKVSVYLSKLVFINTENNLCINSLGEQNFVPFPKQKEERYLDLERVLVEPVKEGLSIAIDNNNILNSGEIEKLRDRTRGYDKVILSIGANTSEIVKYDYLEKSDRYLLIGQAGKFNLNTFNKFSENIKDSQSKCLGFFLLN